MAYDGLDRLTGTSAPGQPWLSASNTYDALDNIRTGFVGSRHYDYTYDSTWRLSQLSDDTTHAAVMTLGYDAFGNVTGKGNGYDSYTFDAANRMQSVVGKESYTYDGYGRRVKVVRSSDGLIDYPVYTMGGQLLTEDDQRVNKTTDYVNLNGSLVGKRSSPIGANSWTRTYEHTDALHSPTYETGMTGTLTRTERYTPYGEPSDGSYTQGPGFTGHVTDAATGLTYAQQRYYDPILGRFLSIDPVGVLDNGASFNRYWYANNNPYKFADPDGRESLTEQLMHTFTGTDTHSEDPVQRLGSKILVASAERSADATKAQIANSVTPEQREIVAQGVDIAATATDVAAVAVAFTGQEEATVGLHVTANSLAVAADTISHTPARDVGLAERAAVGSFGKAMQLSKAGETGENLKKTLDAADAANQVKERVEQSVKNENQ